MFGRCFGYYDFFLFINLPSACARPPARQWRLPGPEVEEILSLPENQEKTKRLIIRITFDIFNGITDFISAQADVVI